jgi:hypothetical protein
MLTFSSPGVVVKTGISLMFLFRLASGSTIQTPSITACIYLTVLKLDLISGCNRQLSVTAVRAKAFRKIVKVHIP